MPAGEVKGLVGHSQSMDTFGIYGHALQGEDAATAGKLVPCLRAWQPQPRSRGKGRHTKRPAKRTAQHVGNIKKWTKKAAENRKCVERADAPPERTACSLKNCIFSSQKPHFSASKYGKCVKKCVTDKKKNRLNPVFKRLFVVGANGLEPLTPCTSSRCSSQLS